MDKRWTSDAFKVTGTNDTRQTRPGSTSYGPALSLVLALAISSLASLTMYASGLTERPELQSINTLFEARPWLSWSRESLARLNPRKIWNYHEAHEIPRRWWAWDYTLSWLLDGNHPPVSHKFVIFNHSIEDEPPREALSEHPWMEPLMHYPISRHTIADAVEFLAKNGARMIVLDNDFPQYSEGDAHLAQVIHRAASGELSGKSTPILMASTINHHSFSNVLQLDTQTAPAGVLTELSRLEPGVDVRSKYTGLTSMIMDHDQVVRRMVARIPDSEGRQRESLALKAVQALDAVSPALSSENIDIDFVGPPNSDLIPVRPFNYLLDPARRAAMVSSDSKDVTVRDAVVLLGDGVVDVYPTPYTNNGVALMSGTEILANSIETIARRGSLHRLSPTWDWLYLLLCSAGGTVLATVPRLLSLRCFARAPIKRLMLESSGYALSVVAVYCAGFLLFAFAGLIVPTITPVLGLSLGLAMSVMIEREHQRLLALKSRAETAELCLEAERTRHLAQLQMQEAENRQNELIADQARRKEFVRRLNHDLKAPVTVLNWTLAKLKREGLASKKAAERLDNIERTSDRLFGLIAELVRTYDTESTNLEPGSSSSICDAVTVMAGCIEMQRPLAESKGGSITFHTPDYAMSVDCAPLLLARVFDNLIRNAFLHNPVGTNLDITLRTRATTHEIIIVDDGTGLSAETLARFSPQSALDASNQGGGLGLSIVQTLVSKLGGQIVVDTFEGGGTTFTLTMPKSGGITFEGKTVASTHLEYARNQVDCALVDLQLPVGRGSTEVSSMAGLRLVQEIRQMRRFAGTLLVLTNSREFSDGERALAAGCDGYLCKHAPMSEVPNMLAELRIALRGDIMLVSREMRHVFIREEFSVKEARLMDMLNQGHSWSDIARELHYKTPKAAANIGYRVFDKLLTEADRHQLGSEGEKKRSKALERWRSRLGQAAPHNPGQALGAIHTLSNV